MYVLQNTAVPLHCCGLILVLIVKLVSSQTTSATTTTTTTREPTSSINVTTDTDTTTFSPATVSNDTTGYPDPNTDTPPRKSRTVTIIVSAVVIVVVLTAIVTTVLILRCKRKRKLVRKKVAAIEQGEVIEQSVRNNSHLLAPAHTEDESEDYLVPTPSRSPRASPVPMEGNGMINAQNGSYNNVKVEDEDVGDYVGPEDYVGPDVLANDLVETAAPDIIYENTSDLPDQIYENTQPRVDHSPPMLTSNDSLDTPDNEYYNFVGDIKPRVPH